MSSKKGLSGAAGEKRRRSGASPSPFDEMASEYDSWFDGDGSLIFAIEVKAFQKLLPALPKPWLEIGVGSGRFARALGIETGIDPSLELVKIARQRGINAIQGRGEQAPFDKGSFGTVFLIVTLCFLDSPLDVLRQAHRLLAPGGKLVLGLVLKESPWGWFYQRKKDEGHRFYKFARFYSRDEVASLLVEAGFTIEDMVSTLFQGPGEVHDAEEPRQGYSPDAGFTIIVAGGNAQ
jgi:SAM-dependent methyltransferase